MPTYQYSCTQCGHFLEVVQAFTDDSLTECLECGGRLRKVFGAVGVVFKGSGFYRTDSRSGSSESGGSAGSGSGSESGSGEKSGGSESGSTGDAKPAEKKSAAASGSTGSTASTGSSSGGSAPPKSA